MRLGDLYMSLLEIHRRYFSTMERSCKEKLAP